MTNEELPHFLSSSAEDRGINVFIWSTGGNILHVIAGLCLHANSHVTISSLYRWLAILEKGPLWKHPDFLLYPVNIEPIPSRIAFLRYRVMPAGDPLHRLSCEPLRPGEYGLYTSTGERLFAGLRIDKPWTYRDTQKRLRIEAKCALPEWIHNEVQNRDGRCVITGTTGELMSAWIVPPVPIFFREEWAKNAGVITGDENVDLKPFNSVKNSLTMHRELTELFCNNDFSIDVDDNYRIVFFQDPRKVCSPELLAVIPDLWSYPLHLLPDVRPDDKLLRKHFYDSLHVNLHGHDVWEEYCQGQIYQTEAAFNLSDDESGPEDMSDPRMQGVLAMWYIAWAAQCARHEMEESQNHNQECSSNSDASEEESN